MLNSILFVSPPDSQVSSHISLLSSIEISREIKVVNKLNEILLYLEEFASINDHCCPELIFLDLENTLQQGIKFLELFSSLYFKNKEEVRIVFIIDELEQKDLTLLKVLGDFDFINKPVSVETIFNCLIPAHSY